MTEKQRDKAEGPKRKSIFELERRRDLTEDLSNLIDDFQNYYVKDLTGSRYKIMEYLDRSIRDWPYRQGANSISDFFDQHDIDPDKKDIVTTLLIIEFYINLLYWAPIYDSHSGGINLHIGNNDDLVSSVCNRYEENIEFFLEQNNYSIREIPGEDENHTQYRIYKRDADVDAALEAAPELSEILLSYLDVRNADSEDFKRSALKQIADYLEHKRKKYTGTGYAQLCDDIFFVFNKCNIRHDNPEFKKIRKPKRIRTYDKTFKMSLHLMQMDDVNRYKDEIEDIKVKLGVVK